MADCSNIALPSENGGSITCAQFEVSQQELRDLCDEVNAITGGVTEEFTGLTSGDRVTLAATPVSVSRVFRNGLFSLSTEYTLSTNQVIFTETFGVSSGGSGGESVVVTYVP